MNSSFIFASAPQDADMQLLKTLKVPHISKQSPVAIAIAINEPNGS
jgi:hypothetical protein